MSGSVAVTGGNGGAVFGDGGVAACLAGVLGNCPVLEGVATWLDILGAR